MLLTRLPHDLAFHILFEWMQIKLHCLSKLDIAHCNHAERRYFLFVMRAANYHHLATHRPLGTYLQWLYIRKLRCEGLHVGMSDVNELDGPQLVSMPTTVQRLPPRWVHCKPSWAQNVFRIFSKSS